jgi:putative transposase
MVKRYEINEQQWERIRGFLPGQEGHVGVTAKDTRTFVNGVLWILRSGAHWRDMPERYGKWNTVYRRFYRWAQSGVWEQVFAVLTKDRDNEYLMLDSTIVRAHQHATNCPEAKKKMRLWGVLEED